MVWFASRSASKTNGTCGPTSNTLSRLHPLFDQRGASGLQGGTRLRNLGPICWNLPGFGYLFGKDARMTMARKFPCLGALGLMGLVGGCSDPVPPAAQGAISLHLATPNSGLICSPGPHWANVPDDPKKPPQTNGDIGGKRAVDGEGGMTVQCKVQQGGDTYTVTATLESRRVISPGGPSTTRASTSASRSKRAKTTPRGAFGSSTTRRSCLRVDRLHLLGEAQRRASQLAIHPGRAWGQVTCRNLTDPSNASTPSCDVDRAFFVIENCQQ